MDDRYTKEQKGANIFRYQHKYYGGFSQEGDRPFDINRKKQFCIDVRNQDGEFLNRDITFLQDDKISRKEDDLYFEENVLDQLLKDQAK